MEIQSPTGRVYQWSGPNPPTADDIAKLQQYESANAPKTQDMRSWPAMLSTASGIIPQAPEGITATINQAADVGLPAVGAASGQALGAMTGLAAPAMIPTLGFIGASGGDALAQRRRINAGQQKDFHFGEMLGSGIMGLYPGASLVKAGTKELAIEGAKLAGINLAAANAGSLLDKGKPTGLAESATALASGPLALGLGRMVDSGSGAATTALGASEGAPMRRVLQDAKDLNMVVPPVVSNPSLGNRTANALAGGPETINAAQNINARSAVQAVRDELGFKPGQELSTEALNSRIAGAGLAWDSVGKASPGAEYAMSQFKDFNAKEKLAWNAYDNSNIKMPDMKQAALNLGEEKEAAAVLLKQELQRLGKGDLWDKFNDARKLQAQAELAKEAISPGGRIDPTVFGRAFDNKPDYLTGKFLQLGRVQSEFNKYVTQNPSAPSGGFIGGIKQLGSWPVRAAILSKPGQAAFATPFYGSTAPDFPAQALKYGVMSAGRNDQQ